jgi:hypothetical protein
MLRLRPVNIVTAPEIIGTDEFLSHLACFSHTACPVNKDIRRFLRQEQRSLYYHRDSDEAFRFGLPTASRKNEVAIVANN